jgi:hypothetical protein
MSQSPVLIYIFIFIVFVSSSVGCRSHLAWVLRPVGTHSDLPAGTAGIGRVHPRWAADRAGTGTAGRRVRRAWVDVFFLKPYPTCLISVPVAGTRVRVRGYSSTRVGGSGTGRVGGSNVITIY